jgi:hypothetical protein
VHKAFLCVAFSLRPWRPLRLLSYQTEAYLNHKASKLHKVYHMICKKSKWINNHQLLVFILLTSYFYILLHTFTSYFILHTSYFILHTSYFILHTSYFILLTSYFLLSYFNVSHLVPCHLVPCSFAFYTTYHFPSSSFA